MTSIHAFHAFILSLAVKHLADWQCLYKRRALKRNWTTWRRTRDTRPDLRLSRRAMAAITSTY